MALVKRIFRPTGYLSVGLKGMFCWMASFLLLAAAAAAMAAAVGTLAGRFGIAQAGGGSMDEPRFFLCGGGAMVGSPKEIPPSRSRD